MKRLKFALFGNVCQAKKSVHARLLLDLLTARNAELLVDAAFYDYIVDEWHMDLHPDGLITGTQFEADVAISMGGDGTFLEAARRVGDKHIPILGINTGRLGFLADVSPEDIVSTIDSIYRGLFTTEERTLIYVETEGGVLQGYPYALNEVAVLKHDNSSMISIRVDVDGEFLATYQADGLLVNTPTGSTGYALSVGGPIMTPQADTFGLVPVAPHSLNIRPITLRDTAVVTLSVSSRSHNFLVAVDGRSESCPEAMRLTLRKAPYTIAVLKRPGQSFFSTLRHKLMWGADVRD